MERKQAGRKRRQRKVINKGRYKEKKKYERARRREEREKKNRPDDIPKG